MELEFEQAGRRLQRERERERLQRERLRRQREKAQREADEAEARLREAAEERRAKRAEQLAAAEAERERAPPVQFAQRLEARPLDKADTNRVALPKSVLEKLEAVRALDVMSGPLTFELALEGAEEGVSTHCGVDEFTAEEGTVGIPPAVALSLAREHGVDWLAGKRLQVRLVQLERFDKVSVAFQPRGRGFHLEGEDVVNIDIKSVLLRTLRDVLTLTEGDWIPMRHEGRTFDLVVRRIAPEPAVMLLNTDVEVELLPSEEVAREEARKHSAAEARVAREARIEAKRQALEPEPAEGDASVVVRARLPGGRAAQRAFSPSAALAALLDWVQTELPELPADMDASVEDLAEFRVARAGGLGAARRVFEAGDRDSSLADLGLAGGRESLMVTWSSGDAAEAEAEAEAAEAPTAEQSMDTSAAEAAGAFTVAKQAAEEKLDQSLEEKQLQEALDAGLRGDGDGDTADGAPSVDKVHVFHALVSGGVDAYQAAQAAQKFASQIVALQGMGFTDMTQATQLLERYQGRLERVVNVLAGAD